MSILDRALRVGEAKRYKTYEKVVSRINDYEPELELESDEEIRERADHLRERAANGEPLDDLLYESFAITREAGKRTLGLRHFDVQLVGGAALHDGSIAEMRTGEGKTLTATLAVVLNSLGGRGVHLVTVNDYLAKRDAEWMKPIYDALGVTVGVLQNMQPYEEKRAAYAADVTYGTNSEFGFDYLRDNMAMSLEEKVQHGGREKPEGWESWDADGKRKSWLHTFAIVDEVDNILIDEARTPLIISGAPEQAADLYERFAKLAPRLTLGKRPDGLGLTWGVLQNMQPYEDKRAAYASDITYGTNSEFGFDYLRDYMSVSLDGIVQRGHQYAIVDEVDSILVDEARTPLIISGEPEVAAQLYYDFARVAPTLIGHR